jgi:hypothetical protein
MSARPKWIALDTMNYWIRGARPALEVILREVDILLVNDAEVRELTQEHNLIKAYRKVQALGPSVLVVKRGEYGVALLRHRFEACGPGGFGHGELHRRSVLNGTPGADQPGRGSQPLVIIFRYDPRRRPIISPFQS